MRKMKAVQVPRAGGELEVVERDVRCLDAEVSAFAHAVATSAYTCGDVSELLTDGRLVANLTATADGTSNTEDPDVGQFLDLGRLVLMRSV